MAANEEDYNLIAASKIHQMETQMLLETLKNSKKSFLNKILD
jgi:hypothetical protein